MHYHIGDVGCIVLHNVHVLISQVQNQNSTIQILFQQKKCDYDLIVQCIVHYRHSSNENKQFQLCDASSDSKGNGKLYTRKELVMM